MRGWGDDGWWIGGPQRSFRRMNPLKCVAEWSPFDRTVIHLQVNNGKGRGTPIYLPNRPKGGGRRRGGGEAEEHPPEQKYRNSTIFFSFPFLFYFSLEFSRRNSSRNEPSIDTLFYCLTFVKSLYRLVIIKLFLMKFSFRLDFDNCLKCSQQWRERERETFSPPIYSNLYIDHR